MDGYNGCLQSAQNLLTGHESYGVGTIWAPFGHRMELVKKIGVFGVFLTKQACSHQSISKLLPVYFIVATVQSQVDCFILLNNKVFIESFCLSGEGEEGTKQVLCYLLKVR